MFIFQNTVVNEEEIRNLVKSSQYAVVPRAIPSLVRENNGKLEYLIIGQKVWQEIPKSLIKETKILHVQHHDKGEPLIAVELIINSPNTPEEFFWARLFIDSLVPQGRTSNQKPCTCKDEKSTQGGVHTENAPAWSSCAGCSYCGPCYGNGYCYRYCTCNGQNGWCYDRVCANGCP